MRGATIKIVPAHIFEDKTSLISSYNLPLTATPVSP